MTALRTPAERIDMIIEEACQRRSVDRAELLGTSRLPSLVTARKAVVLALREFAPRRMSYEQIAHVLCRTGHVSLLRLAKDGRALRQASPGFARGVDALVAIAQGRIARGGSFLMVDLPGVGLVPEMNRPALSRSVQ